MLTFMGFLNEAWKRAEGKGLRYRDSWNHKTRIDDHDVEVNCFKYPEDDAHEIAYHVNGSFSKHYARTQPGAEKRIMAHVYKKVHQFIKHRKPEGVQFGSHDSQKQELHGYLSNHLAKRYGGEIDTHHDEHGDRRHVIRFKK